MLTVNDGFRKKNSIQVYRGYTIQKLPGDHESLVMGESLITPKVVKEFQQYLMTI